MTIIVESPFVFICISCIIVTLWLTVYYRRLQQALYWLHSRQYRRMRDEGELIRERILQDLFIFRRNLELSQVIDRENQQQVNKYNLETFENIHHSLKKLSEYLYPAHIDESLSLAIECLLESWKLNIPNLTLQLNIPNNWHEESYECSRIILIALEELLQITLPLISDSVSIFISLKQEKHQNELILKFNSPNILNLESKSCMQQLDFIKNIFTFFTPGKCFYRQENSTQIWYFYWYCSKQTVEQQINNDVQSLAMSDL